MECEGLETLCIKDQTLTNESMRFQPRVILGKNYLRVSLLKTVLYSVFSGAEKVIGWALSHHLMQYPESDVDSSLVLSCERYLINSISLLE